MKYLAKKGMLKNKQWFFTCSETCEGFEDYMRRSSVVYRYVFIAWVSFFYAGLGCGGGGQSSSPKEPSKEPAADKVPVVNEDINNLWGKDDEVDSQFVYLRDRVGKIQIEAEQNRIIIKNNQKSIIADLADNGLYKISETFNGIPFNCDVSFIKDVSVVMHCSIDGDACNYEMAYSGGGYEEKADTCELLLKQKNNSVDLINNDNYLNYFAKGVTNNENNSWNGECGRYLGSSPEICSSVVNRDGIKYYYRNSCDGDYSPVGSSNNILSDNSNVLRLLRVYSEDEKEGCFLFICNGPEGNFHFIIMPYNASVMNGGLFDIARKIRDVEENAPIAYHTIIRGAYKKDNQCEWYETDDVGYQDVYYDDKVVWDWNNFCVGEKCPYKLMFVLYESDEQDEWGWLVGEIDDYVGYGVIRRSSTLSHDKSWYADKFKMSFRTYDFDLPTGGEFINESPKYNFTGIEPFGLIFKKGIQGVNKILLDPLDDNVIWISAFGMFGSGFPHYRLIRWNHKGTPFNYIDDELIDRSSILLDGTDELDTYLEDMKTDKYGGIWFVSSLYGIAYLDANEEIIRYTDIFGSGRNTTGLKGVDISKNGAVYIGGGTFVARFNGTNGWSKLFDYLLYGGIYTITAGSDCGAWFSPYNDGVYHLDCNDNISKQDFFWEANLNEGWIQSILIESPERIWFGTLHNSLYVWNLINNSTMNIRAIFNSEPVLSPPSVYDLYLDGKNRVWLASGEGIAFIDHDYIPHNFGKYIPNSNMKTIVKDNMGRFWFGGLNGLYLMTETSE